MWFEKDFRITLDKVYHVNVEGYLEVDDVTGYTYPRLIDVLIFDEDDNFVSEEDEHYPELMVIIHERDYDVDNW